MIVGTSLSIQLAAALAHDLFDRLGPVGASAVRFALAAVILLAIVRPAIRGREAATWGAIAAYGAVLAALNVTFFQAISLIPMGIAVTLAFIAPLVMALVGSRRRRDVSWAPEPESRRSAASTDPDRSPAFCSRSLPGARGSGSPTRAGASAAERAALTVSRSQSRSQR
jgi:hypothetical protein